jgi:xylulokinase
MKIGGSIKSAVDYLPREGVFYMDKKLAIIHTTHVTIEPLKNLASEFIPEVKVINFLDDSIEDGDYYDPEEIWQSVQQGMAKVLSSAEGYNLVAIGITSMAETGLLVNLEDGSPYTPFIPWFDMRAMEQARFIEANIDQLEVFSKTGLRASYKHGLPKLLWLLHKKGKLPCNAKWLSAADYIAFKLIGAVATDYTLAARTFA